MQLLREYIRALLSEAIARPGTFGRPKAKVFKLNEFKALPGVTAMLDYAHQRLEELGFGTARSVYRLTGTKVLKVANSSTKGIAQNKAEADLFTNPSTAAVITRIYDYDSSFRWLVSEVVRPFQTEEDFQQSTGILWDHFYEILMTGAIPEGWEFDKEQTHLINGAISLTRQSKLEIGDVLVYKHWGKSATGKTVILDYGYTDRVRASYDNKKPYSEPPKNEPAVPHKEESPSQVDWSNVEWDGAEIVPPESGTRTTANPKLPPAMRALAKKLR